MLRHCYGVLKVSGGAARGTGVSPRQHHTQALDSLRKMEILAAPYQRSRIIGYPPVAVAAPADAHGEALATQFQHLHPPCAITMTSGECESVKQHAVCTQNAGLWLPFVCT